MHKSVKEVCLTWRSRTLRRPKLSKSTYPSESLNAWSPPLQNASVPWSTKSSKISLSYLRQLTQLHKCFFFFFCFSSKSIGSSSTFPVRMMTPTELSSLASLNARISSFTVSGRKSFLLFGRFMVICSSDDTYALDRTWNARRS